MHDFFGDTGPNIKDIVAARAWACGFDLVGVTGADDFVADREAALERIREGRMEGLPWYSEARVGRGASPGELLPGARSVICLGVSYLGEDPAGADGGAAGAAAVDGGGAAGAAAVDGGVAAGAAGADGGAAGAGAVDGGVAGAGRVARYAWVRDYHRTMKRRMRDFVRGLEQDLGESVAARWYVDDGPMLDRAAANRAGIGWFGKNTNVLTPGYGSWVLLGQVITDLPLTPDAPLKKSCGACVRCIDDCPTGAIVAPYVVDNSRCIAYLTIENRGAIPRELRPLVGDWVFGCDICQEVCPVNRKALPGGLVSDGGESVGGMGRVSALSWASGVGAALPLTELLELSEDDFRARFAGTSIMRAKREGMQRNACVALGNSGDRRAVPALGRVLREGGAVARGHAAWALGRIGGAAAAGLLAAAAGAERDAEAQAEIAAALAEIAAAGGGDVGGDAGGGNTVGGNDVGGDAGGAGFPHANRRP